MRHPLNQWDLKLETQRLNREVDCQCEPTSYHWVKRSSFFVLKEFVTTCVLIDDFWSWITHFSIIIQLPYDNIFWGKIIALAISYNSEFNNKRLFKGRSLLPCRKNALQSITMKQKPELLREANENSRQKHVKCLMRSKNISGHVVIGFSVNSDWLRECCEFSGPVAERRKTKLNQSKWFSTLNCNFLWS